MKATYDNSFCMDSSCIHYFEDSCMIALAEKGTEIEPLDEMAQNGKKCEEHKAGTFLQYVVDLGEEDYIKETTYKIATRHKYIGDKEVIKPGDIFNKGSTVGYETIEGMEFTLEQLGQLYIAVDKMLYDFSNQWEEGMNPYEFLEGVIKAMKGDKQHEV